MVAEAAERRAEGESWWATRLWMDVSNAHRKGELGDTVLAEVRRQGFDPSDPKACKAPDPDVLRSVREVLSRPAAGGVGPVVAGLMQKGASSSERFGVGLAADLKRAGPEIHKSLLESNVSTRDWLN